MGEFIEAAEAFAGPIDVFCSNAGIHRPGGVDTSAADWQGLLGRERHEPRVRLAAPRGADG